MAKDLGDGWGVNAHYGYQYIKNAKSTDINLKDDSVSDYRIGVTKDLSGWVAGASLVATSKKGYFTTASGKDAGKTGLVLSLSKAF